MCRCKWIMRQEQFQTPRRHDEYLSAPSGDRVGVPRSVHVALVPCERSGASTRMSSPVTTRESPVGQVVSFG